MTSALATIEAGGGVIDHVAILKSLNLNPKDPNTQALLLVCERYGLDPLLKHMVLISGNPYITRDGYLAIAHRSGVFDGMEVLEQGADGTHFTAKVAVYRKDMGRPFTFIGRYPKAQRMAKEYGPEMAVKVAEVQALRRAFNVTGVGAADERWDDDAAQRTVATHTPIPAQTDSRPVATEYEGRTPPPNVDPATGEVRTRRGPPTKAEPPANPSTLEQVADITDLLDGLRTAGDEWVEKGRVAWKAVAPFVKADKLSEDDATKVFEALAEVYRQAPEPLDADLTSPSGP